MNNLDIIKKIEDFLIKNGWESYHEPGSDYFTFIKDNNLSVDVCRDEIVFIADEGDIMHFPIDRHTYYTVIGYMIVNRMIAMDFKI